MTKEEAFNKIENNPRMKKGELKSLINSISLKGEINLTSVKLGDVFVVKSFSHPAVIVKKIKGKNDYICLLITTTPKDCFILTKLNHRFHTTEQYITKGITVVNAEDICKNYMFSIDTKELNRIKKLFKEFVIENMI